MRKSLLMVVVALCLVTLVGVASASTLDIVGNGTDKITTGRTIADYKAALKELVGADEVGDVIQSEENPDKYLFVPLKKDGEVIGYGTWANTIIYNHPEDMIAVVNVAHNAKMGTFDAVVLKWKPLDANSHHKELMEEEFLSRYYGMSLKDSFNPEVDVISGSTFSSNTFWFELRNALVAFMKFGPGAEIVAELQEAAATE